MSEAQDAPSAGPLAGCVVVDLSRALAGPHAGMLLGDLGARVIKVEVPGRGDDSRHWGPPFMGPADDPISTYFLSCNRNKESVTADLKTDDGRRFVEELAARADVLIENFRPGTLDRLGLGVERLHQVNPSLVVLSISGFGPDGPEGQRAGFDQIAQGEAGLMSVTGPPGEPTKVGVPIADLLAGLHGALGVVAAIAERHHTGRGQVVRTSLLASVAATLAFQGTRATVAGEVPTGEGNAHPAIAPYGSFAAPDATIQIAVGSQSSWRTFAGLVGIDPDDPRYVTNRERVRHRGELTADIETRLAARPAAEWLKRLADAGIPAGRVRTVDEVFEWEQTRSQGLVVTVHHPVLGPVELPGPALRFGDLPYAGGRDHHQPPPTLGQHDESVRAWIDATPPRTAPGTP